MQIKKTRVTREDRHLNEQNAKANAEAAKKLRREADKEMAMALASIDQMGAHESFKAQETVRRLAKRYAGCQNHRQVDAVFYDEQKRNEGVDWFNPINSAFRATALARLAA